MKSTWVYLALACVCLIGCRSGREAGRAAAERDLSRGKLGWEAWGRRERYLFDDYYPLLQARYGIKIRDYGCLVDDRTFQHIEGYNEVMDAEMARRFGTNFWKQAMQEAQTNYAARHSKATKSR
jgi:hypothetical protein